MIKLGIIGISEGNGHPYSFSAIINGFDKKNMEKSGWINIYNYLKERDKSDFGICDVKVTHIWTQNREESIKIAKATYIQNVVENFDDMLDEVDGVIIARDDYENHLKYAQPFLEAGKFLFIDKPLSLKKDELDYFSNFINSNKLFSASGIRYAKELDKIKQMDLSTLKVIKANVVKNWDKYGIHMLDAIFSVISTDLIKSIRYNHSNIESFNIFLKNGVLIEINVLGFCKIPIFNLEFIGEDFYERVDINDYFTAFKRLLCHFVDMIKNSNQDSYNTIELMKVIMAGNISKEKNKEIFIEGI